jgi:hypothetical protein
MTHAHYVALEPRPTLVKAVVEPNVWLRHRWMSLDPFIRLGLDGGD